MLQSIDPDAFGTAHIRATGIATFQTKRSKLGRTHQEPDSHSDTRRATGCTRPPSEKRATSQRPTVAAKPI